MPTKTQILQVYRKPINIFTTLLVGSVLARDRPAQPQRFSMQMTFKRPHFPYACNVVN